MMAEMYYAHRKNFARTREDFTRFQPAKKLMKENRESTHAEVGIPMLSQKYIIWKVLNRSNMYTSITELKVHNESSEHGPEI